MLSNPWGNENEDYLYDVGILSQVVEYQNTLDSEVKIKRNDAEFEDLTTQCKSAPIGEFSNSDLEWLAQISTEQFESSKNIDYLEALNNILAMAMENCEVSLEREKLESFDKLGEMTCKRCTQEKIDCHKHINNVIKIANSNKSELLKLMLNYRTSCPNSVVIGKNSQMHFIELLQKFSVDATINSLKEKCISGKAMDVVCPAELNQQQEFEQVHQVYTNVRDVSNSLNSLMQELN